MLSLVLTAVLFAETPAKPMLDDFLETGVAVPGGPKVKLPKPIAKADPTAEDRKKIAAWIRNEMNNQVFLEDDRARYYYKSKSVEGKQPYHIVTVAFIAYGTLARLEKEKLLEGLLGSKEGKGKKPNDLTDNELKVRKIVRIPKKVAAERYSVIDASLADEVRITGVMRNQTWKSKGQITSVSILDDRWLEDKDNPNLSRKITLIKGVLGETDAKPYSGFGGYARVTELDDPKGALFIEMVFIYHEPKEWFNGRALLVPKLKIGIDDNIVIFRRSLRTVPKPKP